MQLHELQRNHTNKRTTRVGRGGKRGKTSGRGHKGQKARAGHSLRPEARDTIKKFPKLRGHGKNRARTVHASRIKPATIGLHALEAAFESGEQVSPKELAVRGVLRVRKGTLLPPVKILANGTLSKKLTVSECMFSDTARTKIEKAGGSIAE